MQGEVQLIVTSGGITQTQFVGDLDVAAAPNGLYTFSLTTILTGSPAFPCNDPNIVTLVGGTIEIPNADLNSIANIVGWDANTCEITVDNPIAWSGFVSGSSVYVTYLINTLEQKYLDLFENESISQNWKFQDLSNFTAQGAFTREFRIPYSENNQLALGALFDVNVTAGSANYFHYKLPAEIRVDTLPIATGYIRVRKVYRTLNRINEVEIAFYSETPDLVRNIGEKKLADIADLTNLDEIVQYQNVTNPSATRIWTICDRGQLWSEGGEQNTRSLTTNATPVFSADLTPALSWWYLFEKIVTEAGFTLVAGTLETILSNYWMPWLNSQTIMASDSFNELFFRAYNSAQVGINNTFTTIPINTELFDNGNDFNTGTNTFTASGGGWYTFRAIVKFSTASSDSFDTIISLSVNGSPAFYEMYVGTVQDGSLVDCNLRVGLEAGDTVQLKVLQSTIAANNVLYVDAGDGTYNSTLFELNKTELFYGQTIYYNLNAPDMKQIDFVTDVIKMHNCAIVPDRAVPNQLYVVPQSSYLGSGDVLDWTGKLDTSKDIVLSSTADLQKGKFQFTYTAGEDIFSQQYKNVNRIYGDYEVAGYTINPDTAPSDFAIGDQKIQLVTRSLPAGVVNGSGYVIPMFIDSSLKFKAPGPHCLFEAGSYPLALWNDNTSAVVTTNVSTLNHYSAINANIDDEDLNFAPEVPPHSIITNPYNNLFNTYWRGYMNSLYNPDARIMEAFFALDLKDVLTFKFSDKVWIQDSYWRILEVSDYKIGLQESTKVTLLKFLDDQEDCFSTPVSVSVNGEVNFENAAGDPVEPTQDCCVRYGYNWDEVNAICWAFSPTGDRPNSATSGTPTNPSPRPTTAALQNRSIINSVITGNNVTIAQGNSNMLAVGNKLELDAAVSGSNLLGKNTYTKLPGIHLGGGFKDADITNAIQGYAQHGVVILHRKDTYAAAGNAFLFVEGVTNAHIDMPDETVWSVLLHLTVWDNTNNTNHTGQYSFKMSKIGGIAAVSAITTINGINGTAFGLTIGVNVAVTNLHRVFLTLTGGSYPVDIMTTATIQYQQSTRA